MASYNVNGRELKVYEISDSELVSLIRKVREDGGDDSELVSSLLSRFEYYVCPRVDEDNDDVFARFFENFVNGRMHSKEKVAKRMALKHRYLQNEMFKVCLEYIKKLAENYSMGFFDGRNEWASRVSNEIIESLKGKIFI